MVTLARTHELIPEGSRSASFEGAQFAADVSVIHVNNDPGQGPHLHSHPYSETWMVLAGEVQFTVGAEHIDARQGDIVTVSAGTPHAFRNTGTDRLELVCIHASPTFITEWLDEEQPGTA